LVAPAADRSQPLAAPPPPQLELMQDQFQVHLAASALRGRPSGDGPLLRLLLDLVPADALRLLAVILLALAGEAQLVELSLDRQLVGLALLAIELLLPGDLLSGFQLGQPGQLLALGAERFLQVLPELRRADHRLLDLHGDDLEPQAGTGIVLAVALGDSPQPVRQLLDDRLLVAEDIVD